jgi:serine/threonine-protein kinase
MDINALIAAEFPELADIRPLAVRSGQKAVYSATLSGKKVALKIVFQDDGRVDREIAAVAKLALPFVPKIISHGVRDVLGQRRHFVIEEFISGKNLRDVLNLKRRLDLEAVVPLTETLLKACVEFERQKLVHRDIKPENLMIDDDGNIFVLDFGIVRMLELPSLTRSDAKLGVFTAGYSAPEQFRNLKPQIDGRSDLFSVGVVVYEALSGANPHVVGKANVLEILRHVETMDLAALNIPGEGGAEFSEMLVSLTARFPSRRPRTAADALQWFGPIATRIRHKKNA